jgi:TonB family protein
VAKFAHLSLVLAFVPGISWAAALHAAAAPQAAPAATDVRPLPQFKPTNREWYPAEAARRHLTGRVLVEFAIDAAGRATSPTVRQAQADPLLQQAALRLVSATQFDLSDKNYNPRDTQPFDLSVQFCLDECGDLKPYAGYENNEIIVMGVSIPPEKPL